jgi:hypothetical protein
MKKNKNKIKKLKIIFINLKILKIKNVKINKKFKN